MNFQESCSERGYQWVMCQSQFSVEKYLILQTDWGCWNMSRLHSLKAWNPSSRISDTKFLFCSHWALAVQDLRGFSLVQEWRGPYPVPVLGRLRILSSLQWGLCNSRSAHVLKMCRHVVVEVAIVKVSCFTLTKRTKMCIFPRRISSPHLSWWGQPCQSGNSGDEAQEDLWHLCST